eukprot:6296874-Alexandrium_andersonii.AAC.1
MVNATSLRRRREAVSQPSVRFVQEQSVPARLRKAAEFAFRSMDARCCFQTRTPRPPAERLVALAWPSSCAKVSQMGGHAEAFHAAAAQGRAQRVLLSASSGVLVVYNLDGWTRGTEDAQARRRACQLVRA